MAQKTRLRENRAGTIINLTSKQMEKDVIVALQQTILYVERKFAVRLDHTTDLYLKDIVKYGEDTFRHKD